MYGLQMIQKFVTEKTSNPQLIHKLLDYTEPVFQLKQKISCMIQNIQSIRQQKLKKNNQLILIQQQLEDLRKGKNSQMLNIDQQIQRISQEHRQIQQHQEEKSYVFQKEFEKLIQNIQNERKNLEYQKQLKKQLEIQKRREKKNLMELLSEREKKVQQNLQRQEYIKKIKIRNSHLVEAINFNTQELKKMKRKQIQELKLIRGTMQNKVKEEKELKAKSLSKLNKFVNQLLKLVEKGDEKALYQLSGQYILSYELTQTEMKKKHESSETKEDETEIIEAQIKKFELNNPQILSSKVDQAKISEFKYEQMMNQLQKENIDKKQKRYSLEKQARRFDEKILNLGSEEQELDEYIYDLKRRSEQKQSEILAFGILKMHQNQLN